MTLFFAAVALLVAGYFTYGAIVDRVFGPDLGRTAPAVAQADGIDFVAMSWPRVFLIQLLNIAGVGPIFGALAGALWGPVAFLWIVFGSILAGGVHDYLSGLLSMRNRGGSISEIVGFYLGPAMKNFARVFSVVLLVLVGTVFVTGPAKLLAGLTPGAVSYNAWLGVVLVYYFLATMLPIDKLIGRLYPVFGLILLVMAVGIAGGLVVEGYALPAFTLDNLHPAGLPVWALLFVSIACGAISGFHATQSPLMARCLTTERYGRRVFYGAMIGEGIIALIWAAAGMAFYGGTPGLGDALRAGGPGGAVHTICMALLGPFGGVLAILGVVVCPITSGDTAFRSARLTLADWIRLDQRPIGRRLLIAVPMFAAGAALSQMNFDVVWRYFAWSNQTLAMLVLWTGAVYLVRAGKPHWFASVPAAFMTAVSATYLLQAPEGFNLPAAIAYPAGLAGAAAVSGAFVGIVFRRNAGRAADLAASDA